MPTATPADIEQAPAQTGMASAADIAPEQPSAVSRAAGSWWDQVNPVKQLQGIGDTIKGLATHPQQTLSQIGSANDAPRAAAVDAFKRGDYVEGVRHGVNWLLNAVPGVGTTMEKASDQAQHGDVAGGIGTTAGLATNLLAPEALPKAAGAVASGVGKAADATGLPEALYQSALKPSQRNPAKAAAAVQTGLDYAIPVSEGGQTKLASLMSDLNQKTKAVIASKPGATVSRDAVANRLGDVKTQFSNQAVPQADMATIDQAGTDFAAAHPAQIPVADAQTIKQGTYAQLKAKSYGTGELKTAQTESEKALARGIKEELETQFPELKTLNGPLSKLYGLDRTLDAAVARIGNHNVMSLGDMTAGGAGAIAGGAPGAVGAAILRHIVGSPNVKSRLAIALNAAAKRAGTAESSAATVGRIAGYTQALDGAVSSAAPTTGTPAAALPMAAGGNQEQQ